MTNKDLQPPNHAQLVQAFLDKERYNEYQEQLAFQKELNILRNDFYYQMIECPKCDNRSKIILPDALYSPLDILSGDAYSLRKIDKYRIVILVIDGMGKGVSASLSAMLMTAFINHKIDIMLKNSNFKFKKLIKSAMRYIQPILLEEEMISIDFTLIDQRHNTLEYAKFAMPPTLIQTQLKEIVKLKSNNPPMNRYDSDIKISKIDISSITKFLFYTDGVVENSTKNGKHTYASFIEEDFLNSFVKQEFVDRFFSKIEHQEDDVTMIFINKFNLSKNTLHSRRFSTSLKELETAGEWYESLWKSIAKENLAIVQNAQIVFTELMMNAYEHGNLAIGSQTKQHLLQTDEYFPTLLAKEINCTKKISVEIDTIKYKSTNYIITKISDEGDGFDTNILNKIFRNSHHFHGRGVYLSKQSSYGIYYNDKGNSVIFLQKISKDDIMPKSI
jgi:two-component system, HptB-dependent secretion and biofilm response regulator